MLRTSLGFNRQRSAMKLYDFVVKDMQLQDVSLKDYEGKVLLIVNTATRCGFTPQYEGLQTLYEKYRDKGFEILAFPSNQFLKQAPEDNEGIKNFCEATFGITYPQFDKIDVNKDNEHPLYTFLKEAKPEDKGNDATKGFLGKLKLIGQGRKGSDIKWNFTKFLINREGEVVERFSPTVTPEELEGPIEALL